MFEIIEELLCSMALSDLARLKNLVTNLLLKMGVKQKYIKNFIIVRGLADLTTDLHKIIKDWKHYDIIENDPQNWQLIKSEDGFFLYRRIEEILE